MTKTTTTTIQLTEEDILEQLPALSGFALEPKQDAHA